MSEPHQQHGEPNPVAAEIEATWGWTFPEPTPAQRLKNAMLRFEEAHRKATSAGVALEMPPGSGAFSCAGKSKEEQAEAIEEAARELEEAAEKVGFDKAYNEEVEAVEVAAHERRGASTLQSKVHHNAAHLAKENDRLKAENAKRRTENEALKTEVAKLKDALQDAQKRLLGIS